MEQIIEFAGNHPMLAAGFVAVVALLLWSELTRHTRGFREVTPAETISMINSSDTQIVDISPAKDFNAAHIVGARHFAPSRFEKPDKEIEKMKEGKVLVVCKSGQTALQTAGRLVKLGVGEVAVLKGGMTQWKSDNYPVTSD